MPCKQRGAGALPVFSTRPARILVPPRAGPPSGTGMARTLGILLCWLAWHATAARADAVQWRVALGTTGGTTLAIDGAHVYVASAEAGGRGRIVRVPLAGGAPEL